MSVTRSEVLKAVDDIFNYCEEIDNNLPENERSGYKMLPDIHKIRKYIIENTRQHGEWNQVGEMSYRCTKCGWLTKTCLVPYCQNCGSDNRKRVNSL